jgi:hypothetical protein
MIAAIKLVRLMSPWSAAAQYPCLAPLPENSEMPFCAIGARGLGSLDKVVCRYDEGSDDIDRKAVICHE